MKIFRGLKKAQKIHEIHRQVFFIDEDFLLIKVVKSKLSHLVYREMIEKMKGKDGIIQLKIIIETVGVKNMLQLLHYRIIPKIIKDKIRK